MKKIARAIISMGVVLAFSACSWEVPQNVSVRTNADYNFSLGTFEKELDSNMDLSSMLGQTGEGNDTIATYDYFPGKKDKNVQHFLLEVKILDQKLLPTVPDATTLNYLFSSSDEIDLSALSSLGVNLQAVPANAVSLDFNPSTMMAGMKQALGEEMAGKIEFTSIPMYLYCETAKDLKVDAALEIYYSDDPENDPTHHRAGVDPVTLLPTEIELPDGTKKIEKSLCYKPKPAYTMEEKTVITDLADFACIGSKPIKLETLLSESNEAIQENDKLCISYQISTPTGKITRAEVEAGLPLALYAVIDLPVSFKVKDDLKLDINELTKNANGGSSSGSGSSSDGNKLDNEELKKILDVIEEVEIRYVAYQLPFYSVKGMLLGIDLVGDGSFDEAAISVVDKDKKITEADKQSIKLKPQTILKMKDLSSFNPNIQLKMEKGTTFSLPRNKAVEMNLEITLSTDGDIKVK